MLMAKEGSPHPALVWPKSVSLMNKDRTSFLYTMPLVEGYLPVTAAIKNKQLTMQQRAKLVKAMAEPIMVLHRMGLIYGDISDTNFLFKINPDGTFSVRVIDCENVNLEKYNMGLGGTGDYRAPEQIVPDPATGKPQVPSIQSDIHGFGVLSFLVFCRHHPLDGELVLAEPDTPENFIKHYGKHPHFSFGQNNNTPFPLARTRWAQIPNPLKLYYCHLFSDDCLHRQTPRRGLGDFMKLLEMSYPV
jgi:serine/threonine protein kinase